MQAKPSHNITTSEKPSRGRNSCCRLRQSSQIKKNNNSEIAAVCQKTGNASSSYKYDTTVGIKINKAKNMPNLDKI